MVYEIKVPIKVTGDKGGKVGENIAEQIKKSLSSIGIGKERAEVGVGTGGKMGLKTLGVLGAILGVVESIGFILKPILSLFKVILMLLFLPLIPILKPAMQALAAFIKWFAPVMKSVSKWIEKVYYKVTDFIAALVMGIAGVFKTIFGAMGAAWDMIKNAGIWIWENVIVPGFNAILNFGIWIWEMFTTGLSAVLNFGVWLWEIIKGGFTFWIDIGEKLWEFIKSLFLGTISVGEKVWDYFKSFFKGTINVASTVWNWFKGLFGGGRGRQAGGPVSGRQAYLVGEHGPEIFAPGTSGRIVPTTARGFEPGSIIININHPVVRQETDIRRLTNEFSRVLQKQMTGRIAQ